MDTAVDLAAVEGLVRSSAADVSGCSPQELREIERVTRVVEPVNVTVVAEAPAFTGSTREAVWIRRLHCVRVGCGSGVRRRQGEDVGHHFAREW